jgi:hypothetical protein
MIQDLGRRIGCLLVIFVACVAAACLEQRRVLNVTAVLPDRSTCEHEALQVMETAAVYAAPRSGVGAVSTLGQGQFVYRCEQRGEWLGVMFPAANAKVDCSRRPPEAACALGWVPRHVKLQILG